MCLLKLVFSLKRFNINIIVILLIVILSSISLLSEKRKDTIRIYRLGELLVTGGIGISPVEFSKSEVSFRTIQEADVASISELQFYLPSANIRTNSRGEALVFIRGAGDRQTGLFLDGAYMNIPWDNRLDLNLIPTDIIGKIEIKKNSNSVLYGANILGGVFSIRTYERNEQGYSGSAKLQLTDGGGLLASVVQDGRIGDFNYIANASYYETDGAILSSNAPSDLTNQDLSSRLRTNTDMQRLNFYARGEYHISTDSKIGLSMNYTSAEKGAASESHLLSSASRYWRYSDWNRNMITLNGKHKFSENIAIRTTFWADFFAQQIDSYDSTFSKIEEIQNDKDFTFGNRIAVEYRLKENQLINLVYNSFYSKHDETINANPDVSNPNREDVFSQFTYCTGLEYKGFFNRIQVHCGATFDGNITPKTGLFTDNEGLTYTDFGAFLGGSYSFNNNISIYSNLARRSRFPTLREAYSGALGTYTVNPNLSAETGILTDIGLIYSTTQFNISMSAFYNNYDDLIVRVRDPNDRNKRMRINLAKATIYGADASIELFRNMPYILQANLLFLFSEGQEDGKKTKLEYRPNLSASVIFGYSFGFGLKPQFEIEYIGEQYGIDANADSQFSKLESNIVLNMRIGYGFTINNLFIECFARLNNISDRYILSQIGLPEPGRTFSSGISVRF